MIGWEGVARKAIQVCKASCTKSWLHVAVGPFTCSIGQMVDGLQDRMAVV